MNALRGNPYESYLAQKGMVVPTPQGGEDPAASARAAVIVVKQEVARRLAEGAEKGEAGGAKPSKPFRTDVAALKSLMARDAAALPAGGGSGDGGAHLLTA